MEKENIYFEGVYTGHRIGIAILLMVLFTPVFLVLFLSDMKSSNLEWMNYLPILIFALFGLPIIFQKLFSAKKVKIIKSGIIVGNTFRDWNEIAEIKPLKVTFFSKPKYILMLKYRSAPMIGVKVPLNDKLTKDSYNDLARNLEIDIPSLRIRKVGD